MRHGGHVHRQPLGDGGVGLTCFHPRPDEARQVERRQAMSLLVLGYLGVGISGRVADDHRNLGQPCTLRCTPPLRAEVDAVSALLVRRMNDDRLQDAVLPDVVGKLVQLGFRELGARVVRVFAERREGQQLRR
jgi:hypothetical protein